jgi:competence protein ComEC
VRLKQPRGLLNPGGFDYERWLFSQNIGATGYIRKHPQPVLLDESSNSLNYSGWRQSIGHYLDKQLHDSEFLGVIKALTIGDRQQITAEQWQLFRNTGTVHIVAISGLHIGLISGLVFFLVWKLSAGLGF